MKMRKRAAIGTLPGRDGLAGGDTGGQITDRMEMGGKPCPGAILAGDERLRLEGAVKIDARHGAVLWSGREKRRGAR
ncbi:MAG: hypothetical protein CML16_00520 [Pusillimonas sp.]|nr:hypothetical protein [Pusillimonas sp.]